MSPTERWLIYYDGEYIWCQLQKIKCIWFVKYWGAKYRKFGIKLEGNYTGSEIGIRYGLWQIFNFNANTFDMKKYLTSRYNTLKEAELFNERVKKDIDRVLNEI